MKNKLPKIINASTIAGALGAASLFLHAFAQEPPQAIRTMTIVPPAVEYSLAPGDKKEGVMKVINDGNELLTFTAMVRDYVVSDNHGTPQILAPNDLSVKRSAAAWLGVTPSTFTILPHQKQELNYFLQVPLDAAPGGHYAAVIYEPTQTIPVEGTGTGVQTQIGTLFYLGVKGPITEAANAVMSAKGFSEYGPVKVQTEIFNNGDLHIKPKGEITVTNIFGQRTILPLEEHNIFPEKSFLNENSFGTKFMLGRYTARLSATYGRDNNLPLVAVVSFIVFPWKIATVITLIVIILVLLFIMRERKKKKTSPASGSETTSTQ